MNELWNYVGQVGRQVTRDQEYKAQLRQAELIELSQQRCPECGGMPQGLPPACYATIQPCKGHDEY